MRNGPIPATVLALLLCAAAPLAGARALAQEAGRAARPATAPAAAAPFAPADHWSREALRHLAAAGAIEPAAALAAWPLSRARVRALLARAADGIGTAAARLARRYLARFDADFRPAAADRRLAWRARLGTGWSSYAGVLRGGESVWVDDVGWVYPGPRALEAGSGALVDGTLDLALRPALAASVRVRRAATAPLGGATPDAYEREPGAATEVAAAYATLAGPGFDVWAGRRALSVGAAPGGGLVLSARTPFDGVGVGVPDGVRLPGFLGALGPVRGSALLARMERSGPHAHPWFWAMRVGLAPHPSLSVGLNRAAIFGGSENEPVTARRIALMAVGLTDVAGKDSDFENQVASVDVYWAARAFGTPLALYAEWAIDDIGLALFNVPGVVVGAELARLPGVPALAVGAQHVWFDRSCCGNPPWYRHGALAEGWTDRGVPLGHPLGGHGRETAVVWRLAPAALGGSPGATAAAPAFVASGRLFLRRRGEENLFAPDRTGASAGGEVRAVGWAADRVRLRVQAALDAGDAWREWSALAAIELIL